MKNRGLVQKKKKGVRDFVCKECTAIYKGKMGCSTHYCEQCRVASCICLACRREFFIKRKDVDDGRGIFCSLPCYRSYAHIVAAYGENHGRWIGGVKNIKGYFKPYQVEYVALKKGAVGTFTRQEWEELKKKYNYMCLCCKQREPFVRLSVDHIVPLSMSGTNYISNIQPLCTRCNSIKGAKTIDYIKNYA